MANKKTKSDWRKHVFSRKVIDESMVEANKYCDTYFKRKRENKVCLEGVAELASQIVKRPIRKNN